MRIEAEAVTIETGGHVVHFHDHDADLITTVGNYVGAAIRAGDTTLVIATGDHREAIAAHLDAAGIDVAEARRAETFVTLDAAENLARFYADGHLDIETFHSVIGGTIRRIAQRTGRAVRCHGEMVALLWDAGDVTAAMELEARWNDLSREVDFALLCTYSNQSVAGPAHSHARWSISRLHSDTCDTRPGAERHFRAREPHSAGAAESVAALTELSRLNLATEVHQASGMVAVQLGVNMAVALDRLRAWASDHDKALDEVADDVLSRRVRFN